MKRVLLAVALTGCGGDEEALGDTPPNEYPWLAIRYDVKMRTLVSDCTPGRQPPLLVTDTEARVSLDVIPGDDAQVPDEVRVEWTQEPADDGGRDWDLEGHLVPHGDEGAFAVTLGGALEVDPRDAADRALVVAGDESCKATVRLRDADDQPAELTLLLYECGDLRGDAWVVLTTEGEACPKTSCRMRLQWEAVVHTPDPREPAVLAGSEPPVRSTLPCAKRRRQPRPSGAQTGFVL